MADTAGFLIEPDADLFYGSTDIALNSVIDSPGFLLQDPEILFGYTDIAISGIVDSPGFLLPDPEIFFGSHQLAPTRTNDTHGFLLDLITIASLESDDGFLIDFNPNVIPSILGNSDMIEIKYPTIHVNEVNKVLFQTDSEEWKASSKTATLKIRRRAAPLHFEVDTSYIATFLDNLHNNKAVPFRLQTLGYRPFGIDSEDNFVLCLDHTQPTRVKGGLTQTLEVEFLFVSVFA